MEGVLQTDITQVLVQRVFGRGEQTCVLHLLILDATHHHRIQHRTRLVHVAGITVGAHHIGIQLVALVAGDVQSGTCPGAVGNLDTFCQIHQTDDVTGVRGLSTGVGHPHFNAVDGHTTGDGGKGGAGLVIAVVEVMGEEEVTVFVIVVGLDVIRVQLVSSPTAHCGRLRLLLTGHSLQSQTSKLQVCPDTKQHTRTPDEARIGGEGDITCLDQLHDVIFLTFITQFQVLGIDIEGGFRVVVDVEIHAVTHLRIHAHIDLLIEIKSPRHTVTVRQRGVVNELVVVAELHLRTTLCPDLHTARTENLLGRSQIKVHVGEVKLLLSLGREQRVVPHLEILAERLLFRPLQILIWCHHPRLTQEVVTQPRTHLVKS